MQLRRGIAVGLLVLCAGSVPVRADNKRDSLLMVQRVLTKYDADWRKMKADEFEPLVQELTVAIRLDDTNFFAYTTRSQIRNYQVTLRYLNRVTNGQPMDDAEKQARQAVVLDSTAALLRAGQEKDRLADYRRRGESYFEIARRGGQDPADYQRAITDFTAAQKLISEPARRAEVLVFRARSYAGRGEVGLARADFKAALELAPQETRILVQRAEFLGSLGEYQQALADWLRLGRLLKAAAKPNDLSWNAAARLERDRQRKVIVAALQSMPKTALEYTRLGAAQVEAGKLDDALASFNESLKQDARQVAALARRAFVLILKKDYDGALKDAEEALRLDPTHVPALYTRGLIFGLKGDRARLLEDLTEVINRDPELASYLGAFENRAKVYRSQGKADLADADEARLKEFAALTRELLTAPVDNNFLDRR